MKANKLEDGVQIFKRILHAVLINAVSSEEEVEQAKKIIATAREYILAMSIELERRSISTESPEGLKKSLELSAYFTIPKLEVAHRQLALMAAMKFSFANKNYSSALSFANRMLANGGSPKLLDQVLIIFSHPISEYPQIYANQRNRPGELSRSANATLRTRWTSNSTSLPNSTSVLPHTVQSTVARQVSRILSLVRSTMSNTRAPCVGYAT